MPDRRATEEDPASDVSEPSLCEWEVVAVRPLAGFQLDVEFADGTCGRFDLSALIHRKAGGVFAPLRDSTFFDRVFIDFGAVTWPGAIDLAPDAMYSKLRALETSAIVKL